MRWQRSSRHPQRDEGNLTMKDRIEIRERHVRKRSFAATAIIILLNGCMVGPDYRRPAVTTPDAFRGASAAITPDKQSIAELKWFEVFQDEQLQDLIRTALAQNYDLRDAVARVEAARANLGITRSDQFPTFAAAGEIETNRTSRNGSLPLPPTFLRNQNRTFGSATLNLLSFEVDIWGRLRRATEAARANLLGAEEN